MKQHFLLSAFLLLSLMTFGQRLLSVHPPLVNSLSTSEVKGPSDHLANAPVSTDKQDVINREDLAVIDKAVNASQLSSSRTRILLYAILAHRFCSDQVVDLMEMLVWDDDRYEIATAAYPKMVDPHEYGKVGEAFYSPMAAKRYVEWVEDYENVSFALHEIDHNRHLSPLCARDFEDLKSQIDGKAHQSYKVQLVVGALERHYFTSGQIFVLMKKLSWDEDRFKVARASFVRVLDRENFFDLKEAFYYKGNGKRLERYVTNYVGGLG